MSIDIVKKSKFVNFFIPNKMKHYLHFSVLHIFGIIRGSFLIIIVFLNVHKKIYNTEQKNGIDFRFLSLYSTCCPVYKLYFKRLYTRNLQHAIWTGFDLIGLVWGKPGC